ncbi:hypothetical protein [Streptomyces halobius]|uniref:Uncharacterized protein n=1 Tax=Streptomyces halobius TaxID=2879846 RepID=A0ABY4LZ01_9ACTN|nr:hypothetical protein [Streptomyces halobius]UQA90729.1 hypothetical protein K9S39_01450 [Streptomyces halobius]
MAPGPIKDGSGAAHIVDDSFTTLASPGGEDPILRAGNAKFGLAHIKKGGKHNDKPSHPYDAAAKKLWQQAFYNSICKSDGKYYTLYCHPYKAGSQKRTMCVFVDYADFTFHGQNMGQKGIITAYWTNGQKGPNGRDSCLEKND